MATYKITVTSPVMEMDADSEEEAIRSCEEILNQFFTTWKGIKVSGGAK
jgi:hypothetical protein